MSRANDPISPSVVMKSLPRVFDDRPIWAQLNITWKCNLDCVYCTEYDNSKGHVAYDDLIHRIDKCKALGTLHTDLIGGEPMLHPDLTRLMSYITASGMTTGMTTNAFLLTEDRLKELMDAGMGRIQISLDALNPTPGVPKSLKTLRKKIEMVAKYPIWFRVNTVICEQTIDDVQEVAEFCMGLGVPVNFSVVHNRGRLTPSLNNKLYLERVRWLKEQKLKGRPISTYYFLIDYYEKALQGQPMDWTCQAGSKCFYVSPGGDFHFCYHVPPQMPFAEVTEQTLAGNRGKKGCESNCGVDCVLSTSLPFSNGGTVAGIEARDMLLQLTTQAKDKVASLFTSAPEP
jgi:pyrroloquinoline quinone biosynthesis protein E